MGTPHLSLHIEELGISGLDPASATRLSAALEHGLRAQLGALGPLDAHGPLTLDQLRIELPANGSPEAMGTGIAAQILGALSAHSGAPSAKTGATP